MTLVFYAIAFLPDIAVITVFFFGGLAVYFNGLAYLVFLVCALATFVLSILLSLSPIVLMVEGRGVADSLRRSVSLSKPAYGRIIGIHMLWCVCIIPVVLVTLIFGFNLLVYALAVESSGVPEDWTAGPRRQEGGGVNSGTPVWLRISRSLSGLNLGAQDVPVVKAQDFGDQFQTLAVGEPKRIGP